MPAAGDGDLALATRLGWTGLAVGTTARGRRYVDDAPLIGLTVQVRIACGRIDERALGIAGGVAGVPHRRRRADLAAMPKARERMDAEWCDQARSSIRPQAIRT